MGKIGKITPIKKKFDTTHGQTMASSLADKGFTMIPGTARPMVPYKEKNGKYRTGLDPEALYIKSLPAAEQEQERERVKAWYEYILEHTGMELGPNSDYYSKMFESDLYGSPSRAEHIKLLDKQNIFNLDDPHQLAQYAWLRVHPMIAPSYSAWERGQSNIRCPHVADCKFFVDDEEYESAVAYREKTAINKAINSLENMSPTRQLKVAKLLGLPVKYTSKPEVIYNSLDSFIKDNVIKNGQKSANVRQFNDIASMADENIEIRYKVKEAHDYNIYRIGKAGKIYEGEVKVADNEDELVEYFTNPKNNEDYLALLKKIDSAKIVEL